MKEKSLILILFFSTNPLFCQEFYVDTFALNKEYPYSEFILRNKKDLNLIVFQKSLFLHSNFSFYFDYNNLFLLYSVTQSLGNNGKIEMEYCIEKNGISDYSINEKKCINVVETPENRIEYKLSENGYLFKNYRNGDSAKIEIYSFFDTPLWE